MSSYAGDRDINSCSIPVAFNVDPQTILATTITWGLVRSADPAWPQDR